MAAAGLVAHTHTHTHCPAKMNRVIDYDMTLQTETTENVERPLKEWRSKFEANNLTTIDFIQYFEAASPNHFTIEQGDDIPDLGNYKCLNGF